MITLYTSQTGNGHRASIMLEELGLDYRVENIDFVSGGHRAPAFLKVSPVGKIPVIRDDETGAVVAESLAIAIYLAEKTGRLIPSDMLSRARAMQWASIIVSNAGPALSTIFFGRILDAEGSAALIDKMFADIAFYLEAMDTALSETSYLAGKEFSYADVLAIPMVVGTLPRFNVDLTPYPNVLRWRDLVAARPAVQAGLKVPG